MSSISFPQFAVASLCFLAPAAEEIQTVCWCRSGFSRLTGHQSFVTLSHRLINRPQQLPDTSAGRWRKHLRLSFSFSRISASFFFFFKFSFSSLVVVFFLNLFSIFPPNTSTRRHEQSDAHSHSAHPHTPALLWEKEGEDKGNYVIRRTEIPAGRSIIDEDKKQLWLFFFFFFFVLLYSFSITASQVNRIDLLETKLLFLPSIPPLWHNVEQMHYSFSALRSRVIIHLSPK